MKAKLLPNDEWSEAYWKGWYEGHRQGYEHIIKICKEVLKANPPVKKKGGKDE